MIPLRQSTASQEIPLGPFVDETDGFTAETSLTIANTNILVWKAGATTLANKNSGGATHISGGIYYAVLDATDTNTVGPLVLIAHVAGARPVRVECLVMAANVYDAMVAASDKLQVDTLELNGSQPATANIRDVFIGVGGRAKFVNSGSTPGLWAVNTELGGAAVLFSDTAADTGGRGLEIRSANGLAVLGISETGEYVAEWTGKTLAGAMEIAGITSTAAIVSGGVTLARTGADGDTLETISDQLDAVSSNALTAAQVSTIIAAKSNIQVIAPVTSRTIDIIRGDAWAASPRVLDFTLIAGEYWPTTLSTVDFTATPNDATLAADPNAASLTQVAGTVVTPTGDSRKVRITLTAAQTATLSAAGANGYNWWIVANRATAPATLRTGTMTVRAGT